MVAQKRKMRKRQSHQFIAKIIGYNPLIKISTFLILHFKTTTREMPGFGRNYTEIGNFSRYWKPSALCDQYFWH